MKFNYLGRSGLQVSALGFGTWATVGEWAKHQQTLEILRAARDVGINHIDTAEAYAAGVAETELALDEVVARRRRGVITTTPARS